MTRRGAAIWGTEGGKRLFIVSREPEEQGGKDGQNKEGNNRSRYGQRTGQLVSTKSSAGRRLSQKTLETLKNSQLRPCLLTQKGRRFGGGNLKLGELRILGHSRGEDEMKITNAFLGAEESGVERQDGNLFFLSEGDIVLLASRKGGEDPL